MAGSEVPTGTVVQRTSEVPTALVFKELPKCPVLFKELPKCLVLFKELPNPPRGREYPRMGRKRSKRPETAVSALSALPALPAQPAPPVLSALPALPRASIEDLPPDLIGWIFRFLSLRDIGAARRAARLFYAADSQAFAEALTSFEYLAALGKAPAGLRAWAAASKKYGRVDNDAVPAIWHAEVREALERAPLNPLRIYDRMPAGAFWRPGETMKGCIKVDSVEGMRFLADRGRVYTRGEFNELARLCVVAGASRVLDYLCGLGIGYPNGPALIETVPFENTHECWKVRLRRFPLPAYLNDLVFVLCKTHINMLSWLNVGLSTLRFPDLDTARCVLSNVRTMLANVEHRRRDMRILRHVLAAAKPFVRADRKTESGVRAPSFLLTFRLLLAIGDISAASLVFTHLLPWLNTSSRAFPKVLACAMTSQRAVAWVCRRIPGTIPPLAPLNASLQDPAAYLRAEVLLEYASSDYERFAWLEPVLGGPLFLCDVIQSANEHIGILDCYKHRGKNLTKIYRKQRSQAFARGEGAAVIARERELLQTSFGPRIIKVIAAFAADHAEIFDNPDVLAACIRRCDTSRDGSMIVANACLKYAPAQTRPLFEEGGSLHNFYQRLISSFWLTWPEERFLYRLGRADSAEPAPYLREMLSSKKLLFAVIRRPTRFGESLQYFERLQKIAAGLVAPIAKIVLDGFQLQSDDIPRELVDGFLKSDSAGFREFHASDLLRTARLYVGGTLNDQDLAAIGVEPSALASALSTSLAQNPPEFLSGKWILRAEHLGVPSSVLVANSRATDSLGYTHWIAKQEPLPLAHCRALCRGSFEPLLKAAIKADIYWEPLCETLAGVSLNQYAEIFRTGDCTALGWPTALSEQ